MKNWNELQELIDSELNNNLCELQKMIEIYERVGMEKQASEIKQMIQTAEPVRISRQHKPQAA